ncbi:MAG: glycosyltransferase N-terminal domain-containing protein [Leptospiraceae bacterium]
MGILLYNLSLMALYPLYRFLALFHPGLKDFRRSRKEGWRAFRRFASTEKKMRKLPGHNAPIVWLHAASAGELDQSMALAREIRDRKPATIILSVFSRSVKKLPSDTVDFAFYLPLDLPFVWSRLLGRLPIHTFITSTWDVFPNLLRYLARNGTRTYLASGALPANSPRLKWQWFFAPHYKHLTGIGAVDEANQSRFQKLYSGPIFVTGDTRFDTIFFKLEQARLPEEHKKRFQALLRPPAKTKSGKKRKKEQILILASTYKACDEKLFPILSEWLDRFHGWKVWIFPHHIDSNRVKELSANLEKEELSADVFREDSGNPNLAAHIPGKSENRIIIMNCLGLLAHAYALAQFCYIGGAYHHRVHNTAEAAALGIPIITGPRIEASPIAVDLRQEGALFTAPSEKLLKELMFRLAEDSLFRKRQGKIGKKLLSSGKGASALFCDQFSIA